MYDTHKIMYMNTEGKMTMKILEKNFFLQKRNAVNTHLDKHLWVVWPNSPTQQLEAVQGGLNCGDLCIFCRTNTQEFIHHS